MNRRRLRRALALPGRDQRLALEALVMLAWGRTLLGILPFRIAMRWLRLRLEREAVAQPETLSPDPIVPAIADAVRRAASVAPFRAVCLQQSIAAALMLRRRGLAVEVHFGVARDDTGSIIAHAWSRCQGVIVTGEQQRVNYQPISVFVT